LKSSLYTEAARVKYSIWVSEQIADRSDLQNRIRDNYGKS